MDSLRRGKPLNWVHDGREALQADLTDLWADLLAGQYVLGFADHQGLLGCYFAARHCRILISLSNLVFLLGGHDIFIVLLLYLFIDCLDVCQYLLAAYLR